MESGVEDSDHRDVAEDLAGCLDAEDACGVVQRSQGAQLTDGVDDLVGDQAAGLELLTAVDDAVAVRGTVQQCGIIQELEKQQTEIQNKAGYWLHKLTL